MYLFKKQKTKNLLNPSLYYNVINIFIEFSINSFSIYCRVKRLYSLYIFSKPQLYAHLIYQIVDVTCREKIEIFSLLVNFCGY